MTGRWSGVSHDKGVSEREYARRAVLASKAAAAQRGWRPGMTGRKPPQAKPERKGGRDPITLADTLAAITSSRGWDDQLSVRSVIASWRDVVGDDVADHCEPITFDEGVLAVQADSSAWATNLGLLTPSLLRRFDEVLGANVVKDVKVLPPTGPSWKKGRYHVPGRGPRDTYG